MTEDEIRKCSACDIAETNTVLFDIIIPPLIKERTFLCEPCLSIAKDNSKKKKEQ
jgi:hypothetical protein